MDLFPLISKPEDDMKHRAWSEAAIKEFKPKCLKIQMNPTACYGCEDNPLKEDPEFERDLLVVYSTLIEKVSKMLDASTFGWLDGSDVTPLEFSLMRVYHRAMESRRIL